MSSGGDIPRRYMDPNLKVWVQQVAQGTMMVSDQKDFVLSTALGSCISACIRDPLAGIGGMNHFLLPVGKAEQASGGGDGMALRYGNYAMDLLINEIMKRGGSKDRLEIKLFGGGNVVKGISGVGHKNADFIEQYIESEGLKAVSKDLRGFAARRVQYFPVSGRARMMSIADNDGETVFMRELKDCPRVVESRGGDIELFD